MTASYPEVPSSFDPAIYLHSEDPAINLPSESFSDELEALNLQRLEKARNKVVIQHRAWNLSDVFRSDEDIAPNTPTRSYRNHQGTFPSSPPIAKMPFMSSPVAFPLTAPSPTEHQKRKNDDQESGSQPTESQKRQKIMGGFVDDEDDEADMSALGDAHLNGQFDIQDSLAESSALADLLGLGSSQDIPEPTAATEPTSDSINPAKFASSSQMSSGVIHITTCSGKKHYIPQRIGRTRVSYEKLIAGRSAPAPGKAQRSYYGIEIHKLMDEAAKDKQQSEASRPLHRQVVRPSIEPSMAGYSKKMAGAMWTEKYRARKFTDLIGDERTHRSVLRWLKGWDPIVFPGLAKSKPKGPEQPHRKVLLLSGPPGLGKTTLAHVCARQAGYETLEINASDERSRDVVKGRIRDALGTENVKMNVEVSETKVRKVGRPVCVVVDEVDGVVSGSSGGEGGFMKALIDLVHLDQKNATRRSDEGNKGKKRKGDNFRFLRPLILICNDVYHPSLRPLRSSSIAEMIRVRQTPLENVVRRMKDVFGREGIQSDADAVRRLCEASWGLASRRQASNRSSGAEGDIRSVLVSAEWVAHKLRNEGTSTPKLTRSWLEQRVLGEGSSSKSLNRGGVRDIVDRVFTEGAGFGDTPVGLGPSENPSHESSAALGFSDIKKRHAIRRLQEMVDASGEHDRCVADCFASYPAQVYQDDTLLSKPNAAYDWLHFHDAVSSKVYSNQDWELSPYLSQSVAAFHNLFASVGGRTHVPEKDASEEEEHPFSGPRADFAAFEAQKQSRAVITEFQSSLSPPLSRIFRSTASLVTDLIPSVMQMLSPDVKPVLLRSNGESLASVRREGERALIQSAVRVMIGLGVKFEMVRVENEGSYGGWAYRMEPPLDSLVGFSKMKGPEPVRYAVRRALDQEYRKETTRKQSESLNSYKLQKTAGKSTNDRHGGSTKSLASAVKRDFFGRVCETSPAVSNSTNDAEESQRSRSEGSQAGRKVWVSFHDGFSNAVRRPISMGELLAGL